MRILVIADNFIPEIAATSFRIQDHAKHWIEQGHEVVVVTGVPNWPHGRPFEGYKNRLYQEEMLDGVRVIRLWTFMARNHGFLWRAVDYLSFMFSVIAFCWRFPKFDLLLATSPQFFAAVAGWAVSILRWRPWVFEVRDLWPDSIKAVGISKGRLIKWLTKLEIFLYHRANRIVVLTNAFKRNLVSRGIPPSKIDVVTNGVDTSKFAPARAVANARQSLSISPAKFLAGYIGTTGMAHGLETLIKAAGLCRGRRDIHFLIMGEGAEREGLEEQAGLLRLENVTFANHVPHDEVASYYAALDLAIVHLKPDPVFRTVIPSKIFELMAMEIPLLLASEGEAAQIVEQADCGQSLPSGDSTALAEHVVRLADLESLPQLGERGRKFVASHFQRRDKALEMLVTFERIVSRRRPNKPVGTRAPGAVPIGGRRPSLPT